MEQGFSGSTIQRTGQLVEKVSNDEAFVQNTYRQKALLALSQELPVLPRIDRIDGPSIYMEYIDGKEGLTKHSARKAGRALRLFHSQRSYPYSCITGAAWLVDMANYNLAEANASLRIPVEVVNDYPIDALIFGEPQWIEKKDGSVVFIDIEGMGMGSRYQDLGHVYYTAARNDQPDLFGTFLEGYQSDPVRVALRCIEKFAGIISIAYAGFGLTYVGPEEFEKRMKLGFRLLGETGLPERNRLGPGIR